MHRIKVDYEFGFVITTCQTDDLFVCDIKSNHLLWAHPLVRPSTSIAFSAPLSQADMIHLQSHVALYIHVEYDRGYILFTRWDDDREVWRRAVDAASDPHSEMSPPDKKMLDVSMQAAAGFDSVASRRGYFKAWALLRFPESCRWPRLSYPNIVTVETSNACVWNITRSQLMAVIQDVQRQLRAN